MRKATTIVRSTDQWSLICKGLPLCILTLEIREKNKWKEENLLRSLSRRRRGAVPRRVLAIDITRVTDITLLTTDVIIVRPGRIVAVVPTTAGTFILWGSLSCRRSSRSHHRSSRRSRSRSRSRSSHRSDRGHGHHSSYGSSSCHGSSSSTPSNQTYGSNYPWVFVLFR